jgi:hypothetical protein
LFRLGPKIRRAGSGSASRPSFAVRKLEDYLSSKLNQTWIVYLLRDLPEV